MAAAPLEDVPRGTDIFIDANIFVYGLNGSSVQCHRLIERCSREELTGVCLFEVVNEATHVLMIGEAFSKGLIPASNKVKALRADQGIIPRLVDYWSYTQRILSLDLLFLTTDDGVIRGAQVERQAASLLTNDSMIVSCMREYGISSLATNDADFERVVGITVFKPSDLG